MLHRNLAGDLIVAGLRELRGGCDRPGQSEPDTVAGSTDTQSTRSDGPSFEGRDSDTVLFVMGATSAGATTFLDHVLKIVSQTSGAHLRVHHGPTRGTLVVQPLRLTPSPSHPRAALGRLVMVDGTGFVDFKDGKPTDMETAAKKWLYDCYPSPASSRGVIHVQDLSEGTPSSFRNVRESMRVAGSLQCGHFAIAIVKWELANHSDDEQERLVRRNWNWVSDAGFSIHTIKSGEEEACALCAVRSFLVATPADQDRGRRNLRRLLSPSSLDPDIVDGRQDDLIIVVVGQTKSGKSSFLNRLIGMERFSVGRRLAPCTSEISWHAVCRDSEASQMMKASLCGRRLILVDTPGIDDIAMEGAKLFNRVSDWMINSYQDNRFVGGIVYLHDISRDDPARSLIEVIPLFSKLCGSHRVADRVALVTTKWDRLQNSWEGDFRVHAHIRDSWVALENSHSHMFHLGPYSGTFGIALPNEKSWKVIHQLVVSTNADRGGGDDGDDDEEQEGVHNASDTSPSAAYAVEQGTRTR